MRRFILALLLSLGCATPKGEKAPASAPTSGEQAGAPVPEKQKIENIGYFDIAVCQAPTIDVPHPANKEALIGALVTARAHVLECLVDPKSRAGAPETIVAVDTTASAEGVEHRVSGQNLTPEGQKCVESMLAQLALKPQPKDGALAQAHVEVRHTPSSPQVKTGVNEASDVAGRIRLAEPTFCDCFAPYASKAPPIVRVTVKLAKDKANEVTPEPTGDATADEVAKCLAAKVAAMTLPRRSDELTLTYPFVLLNSAATEPPPATASADVQFLQLDAVRGRLAARTAVRIGTRANAVVAYDSLVRRYKSKPGSVSIRELKDKCAALVEADQAWIDSLESQLELDQRTLELATSLAARDGSWKAAADAAQKTVDGTKQDVAKAEQVKAADQAVCPKERK